MLRLLWIAAALLLPLVSGREQRKKSATARARRPDLTRYYARRLPPITPGEFAFALDIPRFGRRGEPLPLDSVVESFSWAEEAAQMEGQIQWRRPRADDADAVPVTRGTRVRCRVRWQGRWFELWTMRVEDPEVSLPDGGVSATLTDDMAIVRRGKRRYVFRKSKRRRHGWFGHEALRAAAKKDGVKLGKIAKCTRRMDKIDMRGSFLDLAVKVYTHEREQTGRRFVLRMRDGKFEAVPYARNRVLYVLADQLREAFLTERSKVREPVTVLTGKARIGKGRDARRIEHTEYNRAVVRKLGYSHRTRHYGRVGSAAELRRRVRRELARNLKTTKTISVRFPGIPFIHRGDGEMILLESEGLTGEESFVYATAVRHEVAADGYVTSADFTSRDPFFADKQRRERAKRIEKSGLRGGQPLTEWRTSGASVFSDAEGYREDALAGRMSFAELGMGTFMGGLAYRTVIEVRYNGVIVRAIKLDIGDGGDPVDGVRREVDLHTEVAAALPGFPIDGVAVVQWRVVG